MADEDVNPQRRKHPVRSFLLARWIPIVLVVLAAAFIAQNRERISIDLFWVQVLTPMWLILLLAVAVGVAIGSVGARRRRRSA
jgi:uncharacterized integral membrane protein